MNSAVKSGPPKNIFTRRLCLRAPVLEDAFDLNPIYNDIEIARWISVPNPHPLGLTLERFQRFLTFPAQECCFILSRKSDRKHKAIGLILANWKDSDNPPIMGFFLAAKHHGKGFMSEALSAAVTEIFRLANADSIRATYYEGNVASEHLLPKIGFHSTGTSKAFNLATGQHEQQHDMVLSRADTVLE
ncbi:MAG: GNAT family N-acetyltransferase [Roseibium sp.]